MPVCQGGQWEYVVVLLHLLGFKLTKSLTFRGLPVSWPLLYEVKSSCVLAPCPWTQPSVLMTRQAAAKAHGNLRKCVISFSGRTVAASPAPVQVSSSGSKYELNNKLSKSNISRISGRSAPVRCHSVLKLHSWKGCRFFKGSMMERHFWLVYRRGWWYSSSCLKASAWWCDAT